MLPRSNEIRGTKVLHGIWGQHCSKQFKGQVGRLNKNLMISICNLFVYFSQEMSLVLNPMKSTLAAKCNIEVLSALNAFWERSNV